MMMVMMNHNITVYSLLKHNFLTGNVFFFYFSSSSGAVTWKPLEYDFYKFFKVAGDGQSHTILGSGSIV